MDVLTGSLLKSGLRDWLCRHYLQNFCLICNFDYNKKQLPAMHRGCLGLLKKLYICPFQTTDLCRKKSFLF